MSEPNQCVRCRLRGGQSNLILAALISLLALAISACQTHEEKARAKLEAMGVEYSEAAFLQKVQEGDNTAVQLFLAAGMQQNKPALQEALMRAIWGNHAETVGEIIAHGADVNAHGPWRGNTALIDAADGGNAVIASELIAHGADVNAKQNEGRTALMYAAQMRSPEIVHELIAHGADVNAKENDGGTALTQAVWSGNEETVHELIAHGADVNVKYSDETPLLRAKQMGLAEVVRELQRGGAKE